jgi:hypothetical protein
MTAYTLDFSPAFGVPPTPPGSTYPPFATVAQYEAMTGQTPAPPNTEDMLAAASAAIRRYCGWHIAPVVDEVLTVDGVGGRSQPLPTMRLLKVNQITEKTDYSSTVITTGDQIEFSVNGYLRKRTGCWTNWLQGVAADIQHGHALLDVADLTQLVLNMTARSLSNPYGYNQQAVGGVSVGLAATSSGNPGGLALFDDQLAALNLYRLEARP